MLIRTGPSHVNATNATPQAVLPLRQSFRQPICAPEPKIHDITQKFLKASEGMNDFLIEAMFKCAARERWWGCLSHMVTVHLLGVEHTSSYSPKSTTRLIRHSS